MNLNLTSYKKAGAFSHLLAGRKRLKPIVGAVIGALGLVASAAAATNYCQKTAQDALEGCQDNAEGDHSIALAKCDNVSDPAARTECRNQAAEDFAEAKQTCRDGFKARKAACQRLGPARYDPVIDPANFIRGVNNPYFPLPPGRTLVYEGQTTDGFEHSEFIITRKTKVIQGVNCIQVHDVVYLDDELAEDTLDWFAQDKQGNVWYFGENTGELENGRFVTLDGTFTAGVNNDKAGIIMEAHPQVGDFYRQEFSIDNAEDFAEVVSLNTTVNVPAGSFHHCLKTEETTPLETSLLEDKYYATGVGNVLTIDVNNGDKLKLVRITTNSE
jgi:hypothetical protein